MSERMPPDAGLPADEPSAEPVVPEPVELEPVGLEPGAPEPVVPVTEGPASAPSSRREARAVQPLEQAPEPLRDLNPQPTRTAQPLLEPASPDITAPTGAYTLPGAHRGGFSRLPTAPIDITTESAPTEPGADVEMQWYVPPAPTTPRWLSAWSLTLAILGLIASFLVGWAFLLGIVAIILGIVALRRPFESRGPAIWGIVLGALSIVYSAGWLLYAAYQSHLLE